jgi:hypothetical protein
MATDSMQLHRVTREGHVSASGHSRRMLVLGFSLALACALAAVPALAGDAGATVPNANPVVPVLTASANALPVTLGGTLTDTATVTGTTDGGLPTGTVAFSVCGPMDADALCASSGTAVGTVAVPGAGDSGSVSTATSEPFTPSQFGIYCFSATFSPSAGGNYAGTSDNQVGPVDTSECVDVIGSGGGGTPAGLTGHVSASTVTLGGGSLTDTATVTSANDSPLSPATVAFYVCGPSTTETVCSSTAPAVGTVSLPATGATVSTATSQPFSPTQAGTYCFAVVFTEEGAGSTDNVGGTVDGNDCATVLDTTPGGGTSMPFAQVATTAGTTPATTTSAIDPAPATAAPAATPALAFTGGNVSAEVGLAGALLLAGLSLVLVARRRVKAPSGAGSSARD